MKRAEDVYSKAGLKVIWMGFQDALDKIEDFMDNHDIDSSVGYDFHNIISTNYGIAYGAGLIAIDSSGMVVKKIPKGFSEDELIDALKDVVKHVETSAPPVTK